LLAFNRLEQSLEVANPKTLVRLPLNALDENGRPVLDWPHENLQQVALVVEVDEDVEVLQRGWSKLITHVG
jgi:hypothetical protein